MVLIFNAPPGSGKDTLADIFVKQLGAIKLGFKDAVYEEVANYYNVPVKSVIEVATARSLKELPNPYFNGLSPRNAMIHVSESVIKPVHGKDYFGIRAAKAVSGKALSVFADGGFVEEVKAVSDLHDVVVIRLHREGFNFDNDSRSYLPDSDNVYDVNLIPGEPTRAVVDIMRLCVVHCTRKKTLSSWLSEESQLADYQELSV